MNISSVLVYTRPQDLQLVREQLSALAGVEVHAASENGRLIVIIEADSVQAVADIFAQINQQPGVLAASMVYHQFEPDPDEEA
ncbi:MAG: chaperone NapD [Candidatus Accumulibacter sp.]|jgi:nitrate reductase NapD|uniref:chaperone NapD n=1 Tax=Candidatus Accumulibacter TaxID=327159 RepID=UPI00207EF924|nr:chaperone NapD [Accumulibacter sp.]MBK8113726.1 chaperone NapD [Accumulibacter sp.]MBK8578778.1 chaperone NapD [Candidatus Accumulibacter propinquus]